MTDSQLKSAIEGVVIKWVHQVEEVLSQDTDHLATLDHYPKPLEEITFWSKRRQNLSHISSQLKDKKVYTLHLCFKGQKEIKSTREHATNIRVTGCHLGGAAIALQPSGLQSAD